MRLIIGLGNPGPKYRNTRHNAGFIALDSYSATLKLKFKPAIRLAADIAEAKDLVLAKPTTFMNNSGVAVMRLMRKYDLSAEDILVVQDDVDIPLGKVRFKEKGSSGGHNGVKSIIAAIGEDFPRVKIGIGKDASRDTADHVLDKFTPEEKLLLETAIKTAVKKIEEVVG
jgi:peptidyl-tRNA hydrolase, PTH1 family